MLRLENSQRKKNDIKLFIEMICKGMNTSLLTFGDKYFEYNDGMEL